MSMNGEHLPPEYENTLGERLGIIIIGSVFLIVLSALTLGVLFAPLAVAMYRSVFYHLKHDARPKPFIRHYFSYVKDSLPESLIVSLFALLAGFALITAFLSVESIIGYVVVYFLMFEALLLVLFALPAMAKIGIKGIGQLARTVFLLGHLHASSTFFSIAYVVIGVLVSVNLGGFWWLIGLLPFVVIYFALSALIYNRTLRA